MSFDESKPVQNGLLISADHRANFLATRQALASINLLQDPLFECWNAGDAVVPGTWALSGAGAAIARETGAADVFLGDMAPRVTFGGATAILSQFVLDVASYDDFFDARTVTAMVMAKQSAGSIARLRINDGADFTDSVVDATSGSFVPLFVEHEVNAAADRLEIQLRTTGAGNVIWDAAVFLFSDIRPARFTWPVTIRRTLIHARRGELFVGFVDKFVPQRGFIVEQVQLDAETAPLVTDVIADVLQWDGATNNSMFVTRPTILAGAVDGGAEPDGVYSRRCFVPKFGAGAATVGQRLRTEIDQVGTDPDFGTDLNVYIRYKAWARPQELIAAASMVV